ncbi:alpha/beta hydrolase [Streptomyces hygroscopicus]|uniref:alpha/beta hydrolase n=1 Tax=Streptomyces hygroscopicus TaxID=1912 RepID=UPI0033E106BB
MDLKTLKALKPSEFENAADGYRAMGNMASAAKDHIDNQIAVGMRNSLKGEALQAAQEQLRQLSRNFHYTQVECSLISTALNAFAFDVGAAKKKLDAALEDAGTHKFTVNSDGSVSYPAAGKASEGKKPEGGKAHGVTDPTASAVDRQAANFDPNPNFKIAQGIANRIAHALEEATEADEKWAPKLRALKADDDLVVSGRDWVDVKSDTGGVNKAAKDYLDLLKDPPKHGTPKENASWWKGLSEEQRAEYITLHPDSVGRMDGLPADVRSEANQLVLAETRGVAQGQLNDWLKKEPKHYEPYLNPMTGTTMENVRVPTEEWKRWDAKRKEIQSRIDGMDAIQMRFDTYTDEGKRPYLLGIDNKNRGHAIVSIGNPDTADNVATYVPGTFAKLSSVDGDIRRAELLQRQAERADRHHSTASILWLGYDAPQSIMGDASETKFADEARKPLNDFLTGIDTAHGGHVNSTLIGHSYGSLVAGETMRDHPDVPVDSAIAVGSPGMGVKHADDLNIPRDHMWAATARNDLINLAPPKAGFLAPLNPMEYVRLFDDHTIVHGTDPTTDDFGGQTFKVADGKAPGSDGLMPAHSQYWEGKSLNHMAEIVTGGRP